jgi:predicted RNA-binding Zn-ribbon protein involved in translation (DUF1610 family)
MSDKPTSKVVIPDRAFDGNMWHVPAYVEVKCPHCGVVTRDQPVVMRYSESFDVGGEHKRTEPLWSKRGWRVWWACSACGNEWYKRHESNYATTEDIQDWIAEFRRWYLSFKWDPRA